MNRAAALRRREEQGRPVRVGIVGAGAFGAMYAAQARRTPGVRLVGVADLDRDRARARLGEAGWSAADLRITDDAAELLADGLDVLVEATGSPVAGARHALTAIDAGVHVVMVTVEADVLVGPGLAERARRAGVVYSLAYGDQPALICELVDWARTAGFEVVAAGKGTKHLPEYHASTPETVWELYGLTEEQVAAGGFNPRMFNSFLDGTKSAIEMAAVANATGLDPPAGGLAFPPAGVDELAAVLRPREDGGALERAGVVEVVSSLRTDGTPVERDLRWGVYVAIRAGDDWVAQRFADYGVPTDDSGRYAVLYRPYHVIGLELGVSVAAAALDGQPTGAPVAAHAEVVATAKRDLAAGEVLDGEGGYTVYGVVRPADAAAEPLPIGLAHGARLQRPVGAGQAVQLGDVELGDTSELLQLRRELAGGS